MAGAVLQMAVTAWHRRMRAEALGITTATKPTIVPPSVHTLGGSPSLRWANTRTGPICVAVQHLQIMRRNGSRCAALMASCCDTTNLSVGAQALTGGGALALTEKVVAGMGGGVTGMDTLYWGATVAI